MDIQQKIKTDKFSHVKSTREELILALTRTLDSTETTLYKVISSAFDPTPTTVCETTVKDCLSQQQVLRSKRVLQFLNGPDFSSSFLWFN